RPNRVPPASVSTQPRAAIVRRMPCRLLLGMSSRRASSPRLRGPSAASASRISRVRSADFTGWLNGLPSTMVTYVTSVQYTEQLIGQGGLVPVVVLQDAADAGPLAEALLAGGLRCVEVTFRTDAAAEAIAAMAKHPELLVGAGTVLSEEQARQAIDA